MTTKLRWLALISVVLPLSVRAEAPPSWAYPVNPPGPEEPDPPEHPVILPGSAVTATSAKLDDMFGAVDWFPGDHPAPPPLVARGAQPAVYACGYCHLPDGTGRPENATLAGLSARYIIAQVEAFANGTRRSTEPAFGPATYMAKLSAAAAHDPGLAEAARYFSALKPVARYKVVEAETVPKTEISAWITKPAADGTEPIGARLIVMPDDFERFELRDPHLTYTVFAPPGSVKRGEALVKNGGGRTVACSSCHGADLRGQGAAPTLLGRSPGYLARQLHDIQTGSRHDAAAAPMKPVVSRLGNAELIAITAYLASLPP